MVPISSEAALSQIHTDEVLVSSYELSGMAMIHQAFLQGWRGTLFLASKHCLYIANYCLHSWTVFWQNIVSRLIRSKIEEVNCRSHLSKR
jgi:hypothetical protein